LLEIIDVQDVMAWETQGPIARRELEKLGTTDRGVIMLRNILKRELENIDAGRDPMGTVRDPAKNERIEIAREKNKAHHTDGFENLLRRRQSRFSPFADDLCRVFATYGEAQVRKKFAGVS
jgi:5,5'-dehydrodivanillate O-demethylase